MAKPGFKKIDTQIKKLKRLIAILENHKDQMAEVMCPPLFDNIRVGRGVSVRHIRRMHRDTFLIPEEAIATIHRAKGAGPFKAKESTLVYPGDSVCFVRDPGKKKKGGKARGKKRST